MTVGFEIRTFNKNIQKITILIFSSFKSLKINFFTSYNFIVIYSVSFVIITIL